MSAPPPRAVIADDERLMRDQLRARLAEAWPELAIVGEARNGAEAIELVQRLRPDLVFLDVRMPGSSGIEAARALAGQVQVVFVTAYDEYAVEAFEQGAIDYLLKPAERARLALTVERLKRRLAEPPAELAALLAQLSQRMTVQLDRLAPPAEAPARRPALQWIQAGIGNELRMIPVDEVLFFMAGDKYTRVVTAGFEALIRKPIRELADELDPDRFWQIHRATLVNTGAIAGVARDLRGRQLVSLRGCAEKLEVSRGYAHLFKQM
ncbi:LytR/AlgR family response regulator transcription factor [Derxia lacustris]|uniref:LytR/AlgR family response regulator transcription factor n=1 Tax=Derxia lacustris TaxID=764842 RepID=UPI000A175C43|nr:LytTR family DNA-binding domain-containing protein [Derxia lacustris]